MANIYLMLDEKKDYATFKVGYASNLAQRFIAYVTCNCDAQCISVVATQKRSKHKLETCFHDEIIKRGYKFQYSKLMPERKTEWFAVEYNDPFYTELKEKGLLAFNIGKGRKEKVG